MKYAICLIDSKPYPEYQTCREVKSGEILPLCPGEESRKDDLISLLVDGESDLHGYYKARYFEEIEIIEKPKEIESDLSQELIDSCFDHLPKAEPFTNKDRLLLAGMAMQGILSATDDGAQFMPSSEMAKYSVLLADALLEELEK